MSNNDTERQRRIADLEDTLRLAVPETIRRQMEELQSLISFGDGSQFGDVKIGDVTGGDLTKVGGNLMQGSVVLSNDARLNGVAVGVNLGTIIYGRDPSEDERRRLAWYLASLANKLSRLPLRGIEEHLDQGEGLALPQVYVMLATKSEIRVAQGAATRPYFQGNNSARPLDRTYDPTQALPYQAIIRVATEESTTSPLPVLYRAQLCTEAVQQYSHLVLLGAPGGGKSTFIRHLAWSLARRGLDQRDPATALFGWDDARCLLPIILPLRTLAGRIAAEGVRETTVFAALRDEIQSFCMHQIDDMLSAALHQGTVLLLCDGLDEVPSTHIAGQSAARTTTMAVLRAFATMYPTTRIVVTCRIRAFTEDLRTQIGWPVETLAPFTLGQVRHFVPTWYGELVAKKHLTPEQAERISASLINSIIARTKFVAMAETPLLLTLMALVLFKTGELPLDRPQLYERILNLLLGQWDQVREGHSMSEAIGLPDWGSERFRPILDQLSYQAHMASSSEDGRGRLGRGALYTALIDFFTVAQVPEPWSVAARWLDYIEQRSGLLVLDGSESYVFAHLTLQEHCAGRHIALNSDDPAALAMQHRTDDRWREPIFLGAGLMRPADLNVLLTDLIDRENKDDDLWYRDLILAAELGKERDWNYLRIRPMVRVERLQREIKKGMLTLLADTVHALPIAERVCAGFLLGELDDPRLLDPERGEARGTPRIPDVPPYWVNIAGQSSQISRYPVANAEFRHFLDANGPKGYDRDQPWWTVGGQAYLANTKKRPPYPAYWHDWRYNQPSQPVVGITWFEAVAYCRWLTAIGHRQCWLPRTQQIRLPVWHEWERAARAHDQRIYPWGDEQPNSERANYHETWMLSEGGNSRTSESSLLRMPTYERYRNRATPVGCFPAGMSANRALDMAGNVTEWTATPARSATALNPLEDLVYDHDLDDVILAGGGFGCSASHLACSMRSNALPDIYDVDRGFRIVRAQISDAPTQSP